MGKAISGNKYPLFDWFTAGLLGVGTSIFLLSQDQGKFMRLILSLRKLHKLRPKQGRRYDDF